MRVHMVCEWARGLIFLLSILGERDVPKSLNWCSRLKLRSHTQVRTHARTHVSTHTGKHAHVIFIAMTFKQKTKVDVQ